MRQARDEGLHFDWRRRRAARIGVLFGPQASDATRASHRQYVRAFSASDDFALTGLVVTQQVGENPWHYCPSPQFVVTLEGSWYIRTSDGKTTTFKPGVRGSASFLLPSIAPMACWWGYAVDATRRIYRGHADAIDARIARRAHRWHTQDVLYQDNSAEHPLAKLGASGQAPSGAQHWSGAEGRPCNQLVLGVKPRVFPSTSPGTW
jgi:hypothetical protein